MFKGLAKDTAYYGISTMLGNSVQFILLPIYSRMLGQVQFGQVELLVVISAYLMVTLPLEISQGFGRCYSTASSHKDQGSLATSAWQFTVLVYGLFGSLLYLFPAAISEVVFNAPTQAYLIQCAGGACIANGLCYACLNQLRWARKPNAYLATVAVQSASTVVFTLLAFFRWEMVAAGPFIGQLMGASVGLLLAVCLSVNIRRERFRIASLRVMLHYSLPLVPSSIAVVALASMERLATSLLLGLAELGALAIAVRVAALSKLFTNGLSAAFTPHFYQSHEDPGAPRKVATLFQLYVLGSAIVVATTAILVPILLPWIMGHHLPVAETLVAPLIATNLIINMPIFAPGLGLARKSKRIALIYGSGAILSLMLNIILTDSFGLSGICLAATLSSSVVAAIFLWQSKKFFGVNYQVSSVIAPLSITALITICMAFLEHPPAFFQAMLLAMIVLSIALAARIIRPMFITR